MCMLSNAAIDFLVFLGFLSHHLFGGTAMSVATHNIFVFMTNVLLFDCLERVLTGNNISEINNCTLEGLQYSAMEM